jgi:hypothetical protein
LVFNFFVSYILPIDFMPIGSSWAMHGSRQVPSLGSFIYDGTLLQNCYLYAPWRLGYTSYF